MNADKLQKIDIEKVAISIQSFKVLKTLIKEFPYIEELLKDAESPVEANEAIVSLVMEYFESNPTAYKYYSGELHGKDALNLLEWRDYAAIRLMDYTKHAGTVYEDPNIKINKEVESNPIKVLWQAINLGTGGAKPDFFIDMLQLLRQFYGTSKRKTPGEEEIKSWMLRHPSGMDTRIRKIREKNKKRIINTFIKKIDAGEISDKKYYFQDGMNQDEKRELMNQWWDESLFHLRFAIRSTQLLNEMLDNSLSPEQLEIFIQAQKMKIPIFINPYYLSLLNTKIHGFAYESDRSIRDYIMINQSLVDEFGNIIAWEKEDIVEPGKPNAAGFILPNLNVHRRYPEVAIMIPDTVGRACAGLCVSCQRMYDFQKGNLNFELESLIPKKTWWEKLEDIMDYFENDSQLRDILITGGDALMSSNKSLERIFNAIIEMAERKTKANENRPNGEKYAPIQRIRLGTRIPVYLPQRITPELIEILKEFKRKANKVGIEQLIIQTHFISSMEVTAEAEKAVGMLLNAGWVVTNQLVFTTATSRRGHTSKLRQTLNKIGILPYYSFSVKGFLENSHNFTNNARAVQEMLEEKSIGEPKAETLKVLKDVMQKPEMISSFLNEVKKEANIPFLATDKNVMNLPGVGKSLTFRTIGITPYGKRILEFDHDPTRKHSPIIKKMGKVVIIESKSIRQYLTQLMELGDDPDEYQNIYGYSIGEVEDKQSLYEYPTTKEQITDKLTNFSLD